jgi:hypothetical protein
MCKPGPKNDEGVLAALIDRNPKHQQLATEAIYLYHHITTKALKNE